MEVCSAPTLCLKALTECDIVHIMCFKIENVVHDWTICTVQTEVTTRESCKSPIQRLKALNEYDMNEWMNENL